MKKQIISILLALCVVLTPPGAFAAEGDQVKEQFAAGDFPFAGEVYEDNAIADSCKLTLTYQLKEQQKRENEPAIGCKAAFLADPVSGKVFFEKNAHEKMYPASTTKILTALLALENCDLEELVTVSEAAHQLVNEGYSNANLQAGEKLSVYTMLQALMIPSANEAAYALAEHIGGSIEAFADLSNKRAKELGCENLHFINPNGLHDEDHYCSAYDLYLIAKQCQKYEAFREIVQSKSFTVPATDVYEQEDRTFENTNELLLDGSYYYSYCTGIKTGHTTPAGECLVASSFRDDVGLISVVMGGAITEEGNERFTDTRKLFEFVYENYAFKRIADKSKPLAQVNVLNAISDQAMLDVVILTDIYSVAPNEFREDSVGEQINIAEDIKAPIQKNQVLGTVTYRIDGLVYTTNIVAGNEVKKKPFWLYNSLVALGLILIALVIVRAVKKAKRKKKQRDK